MWMIIAEAWKQDFEKKAEMSIKILLADDHQVVRQGLHALLEREPDMEVVAEAADAETTIRLARELLPQVVIMDAALPGMLGLDIVRQLLGEFPGVKVIALSMHSDRRVALNMLKAGASAYLLKDCAFEELARAIRDVMANRTYLSPGVSDIVIKEYIEALRESEARFRTIFECATIGIALLDMEGRLLETNPVFQEMLGYSRDELQNMVFCLFAHPEDAGPCMNLFHEVAAKKRESYRMEKRYIRKDGRTVWSSLTLSRVRCAVGESRFAIAMVEDITERKEAEERIRAYQEQLRSLASELSLLEERERRSLATDLHDQIGQILALAQIKMGELRKAAASSPLVGPLDEVRHLIEQTIKTTRSLTFELSPPILYDLGFEAAVEWFGEHLQDQRHLQVEVMKDNQPRPIDSETRVLLFKAVRELMINAAKHAQAQHLQVAITREGKDLLIKVMDDGVGFDVAQIEAPSVKTRGFGLFSIRERLQHIGGRLQVDSEPGRGTKITLTVPLWQEEKTPKGK
jgi:PAS domain S-box-containing protein